MAPALNLSLRASAVINPRQLALEGGPGGVEFSKGVRLRDEGYVVGEMIKSRHGKSCIDDIGRIPETDAIQYGSRVTDGGSQVFTGRIGGSEPGPDACTNDVKPAWYEQPAQSKQPAMFVQPVRVKPGGKHNDNSVRQSISSEGYKSQKEDPICSEHRPASERIKSDYPRQNRELGGFISPYPEPEGDTAKDVQRGGSKPTPGDYSTLFHPPCEICRSCSDGNEDPEPYDPENPAFFAIGVSQVAVNSLGADREPEQNAELIKLHVRIADIQQQMKEAQAWVCKELSSLRNRIGHLEAGSSIIPGHLQHARSAEGQNANRKRKPVNGGLESMKDNNKRTKNQPQEKHPKEAHGRSCRQSSCKHKALFSLEEMLSKPCPEHSRPEKPANHLWKNCYIMREFRKYSVQQHCDNGDGRSGGSGMGGSGSGYQNQSNSEGPSLQPCDKSRQQNNRSRNQRNLKPLNKD